MPERRAELVPESRAAEGRSDTSRPAHDDVDTAVMTLSPEFLSALRAIAPKARHAKLPYVFALALVTVVGAIGGSRTTRDFLVSRWLHRSSIARPLPGAIETPPAERAQAERTPAHVAAEALPAAPPTPDPPVIASTATPEPGTPERDVARGKSPKRTARARR